MTSAGLEGKSMVQSLARTPSRVRGAPAGAPRRLLRIETVLIRCPIHTLTTGGAVIRRLSQTTAQGALDLRWAVSANAYSGSPHLLASTRDTLVLTQRRHALPRP